MIYLRIVFVSSKYRYWYYPAKIIRQLRASPHPTGWRRSNLKYFNRSMLDWHTLSCMIKFKAARAVKRQCFLMPQSHHTIGNLYRLFPGYFEQNLYDPRTAQVKPHTTRELRNVHTFICKFFHVHVRVNIMGANHCGLLTRPYWQGMVMCQNCMGPVVEYDCAIIQPIY